jgi:hypothetical protein
MLTRHFVVAAILCGPPFPAVLILDQRRHTRELSTALMDLRARAPDLTTPERQAALDAVTGRYGAKWTPRVRQAARDLGVQVDKIRVFEGSLPVRDKRALWIFAGFIVLLVLVSAAAAVVS